MLVQGRRQLLGSEVFLCVLFLGRLAWLWVVDLFGDVDACGLLGVIVEPVRSMYVERMRVVFSEGLPEGFVSQSWDVLLLLSRKVRVDPLRGTKLQ